MKLEERTFGTPCNEGRYFRTKHPSTVAALGGSLLPSFSNDDGDGDGTENGKQAMGLD